MPLPTCVNSSPYDGISKQAKPDEAGIWQGQFRGLRLSSVFQPVVTLSTGRVVGHEGLVRLDYADGRGATPFRFFSGGLDEVGLVDLDRLCRLLHLRNFQRQAGEDAGWLFLNVSPLVVASRRRHGEFLAPLLEATGFNPARVVVEIAESGVQDGDTLADAVAHYRRMGCLVAIDDYGVGLSSVTRLWSLGVDIVKLDRELLRAALASPDERRLLPSLVEFLHDCGTLVLMEGVETFTEALLALEVGCDLAQGFHFARPAASLLEIAATTPIDALRAAASSSAAAAPLPGWLDEWRANLAAAARRLAAGDDLRSSTAPLLGHRPLLRCYWLDRDGIQRGDSVMGTQASAPRFPLLLDQHGADASESGYFARAVARPDAVQISRAHLQRGFGVACLTLAVTAPLAGVPGVLCCDLAWGSDQGTRPSGEGDDPGQGC
ncbi:MAG: EAL domain-containing protein [Immundisolibacter sp.]|uniref:EAL domain-containing protein n=1 Tax=Immundisolibacter sp. TaxID=1934948 RepID=UPI003EDECFC1